MEFDRDLNLEADLEDQYVKVELPPVDSQAYTLEEVQKYIEHMAEFCDDVNFNSISGVYDSLGHRVSKVNLGDEESVGHFISLLNHCIDLIRAGESLILIESTFPDGSLYDRDCDILSLRGGQFVIYEVGTATFKKRNKSIGLNAEVVFLPNFSKVSLRFNFPEPEYRGRYSEFHRRNRDGLKVIDQYSRNNIRGLVNLLNVSKVPFRQTHCKDSISCPKLRELNTRNDVNSYDFQWAWDIVKGGNLSSLGLDLKPKQSIVSEISSILEFSKKVYNTGHLKKIFLRADSTDHTGKSVNELMRTLSPLSSYLESGKSSDPRILEWIERHRVEVRQIRDTEGQLTGVLLRANDVKLCMDDYNESFFRDRPCELLSEEKLCVEAESIIGAMSSEFNRIEEYETSKLSEFIRNIYMEEKMREDVVLDLAMRSSKAILSMSLSLTITSLLSIHKDYSLAYANSMKKFLRKEFRGRDTKRTKRQILFTVERVGLTSTISLFSRGSSTQDNFMATTIVFQKPYEKRYHHHLLFSQLSEGSGKFRSVSGPQLNWWLECYEKFLAWSTGDYESTMVGGDYQDNREESTSDWVNRSNTVGLLFLINNQHFSQFSQQVRYLYCNTTNRSVSCLPILEKFNKYRPRGIIEILYRRRLIKMTLCNCLGTYLRDLPVSPVRYIDEQVGELYIALPHSSTPLRRFQYTLNNFYLYRALEMERYEKVYEEAEVVEKQLETHFLSRDCMEEARLNWLDPVIDTSRGGLFKPNFHMVCAVIACSELQLLESKGVDVGHDTTIGELLSQKGKLESTHHMTDLASIMNNRGSVLCSEIGPASVWEDKGQLISQNSPCWLSLAVANCGELLKTDSRGRVERRGEELTLKVIESLVYKNTRVFPVAVKSFLMEQPYFSKMVHKVQVGPREIAVQDNYSRIAGKLVEDLARTVRKSEILSGEITNLFEHPEKDDIVDNRFRLSLGRQGYKLYESADNSKWGPSMMSYTMELFMLNKFRKDPLLTSCIKWFFHKFSYKRFKIPDKLYLSLPKVTADKSKVTLNVKAENSWMDYLFDNNKELRDKYREHSGAFYDPNRGSSTLKLRLCLCFLMEKDSEFSYESQSFSSQEGMYQGILGAISSMLHTDVLRAVSYLSRMIFIEKYKENVSIEFYCTSDDSMMIASSMSVGSYKIQKIISKVSKQVYHWVGIKKNDSKSFYSNWLCEFNSIFRTKTGSYNPEGKFRMSNVGFNHGPSPASSSQSVWSRSADFLRSGGSLTGSVVMHILNSYLHCQLHNTNQIGNPFDVPQHMGGLTRFTGGFSACYPEFFFQGAKALSQIDKDKIKENFVKSFSFRIISDGEEFPTYSHTTENNCFLVGKGHSSFSHQSRRSMLLRNQIMELLKSRLGLDGNVIRSRIFSTLVAFLQRERARHSYPSSIHAVCYTQPPRTSKVYRVRNRDTFTLLSRDDMKSMLDKGEISLNDQDFLSDPDGDLVKNFLLDLDIYSTVQIKTMKPWHKFKFKERCKLGGYFSLMSYESLVSEILKSSDHKDYFTSMLSEQITQRTSRLTSHEVDVFHHQPRIFRDQKTHRCYPLIISTDNFMENGVLEHGCKSIKKENPTTSESLTEMRLQYLWQQEGLIRESSGKLYVDGKALIPIRPLIEKRISGRDKKYFEDHILKLWHISGSFKHQPGKNIGVRHQKAYRFQLENFDWCSPLHDRESFSENFSRSGRRLVKVGVGSRMVRYFLNFDSPEITNSLHTRTKPNVPVEAVALFLFLDAIWIFDTDGNPVFRLASKPPEVRKVILIRDKNKHSAKAKEKLVTLKAALDRLALDDFANLTSSSTELTLHSAALSSNLEKTLVGLREEIPKVVHSEQIIGDDSDSDSDVPILYQGDEEDTDLRNLRLLMKENTNQTWVKEPELADMKREIIQSSFPNEDDLGEADLLGFNPFDDPGNLADLLMAIEAEGNRSDQDDDATSMGRLEPTEVISEAHSSVRKADSRILEDITNVVTGTDNTILGDSSSSAIFDIDTFYEDEEDLVVGTSSLTVKELIRPRKLLRTIRGRVLRGPTDLDTLIQTIERTSVLGTTWADTKAWNARIRVLGMLKRLSEGMIKEEEVDLSREDLKWFILPLISVPVSVFHSVDLVQDLYCPSYSLESGRIVPGEEKMIDESIRNVLTGKLQGNLSAIVASLEDPGY